MYTYIEYKPRTCYGSIAVEAIVKGVRDALLMDSKFTAEAVVPPCDKAGEVPLTKRTLTLAIGLAVPLCCTAVAGSSCSYYNNITQSEVMRNRDYTSYLYHKIGRLNYCDQL